MPGLFDDVDEFGRQIVRDETDTNEPTQPVAAVPSRGIFDDVDEYGRQIGAPEPGMPEEEPGILDQLVGGYYDFRSRAAFETAVQRAKPTELEKKELTPGSLAARGYEPGTVGALVEKVAPEERKRRVQEALDQSAMFAAKGKEIPLSKETMDFLDENSGKTVWEAFKEAPIKIIAELGARSGASMAPGMALGIGAGALGGGPLGFAAGMGAGSARVDYAATIMGELQQAGVDLTDAQAVTDFVNSPAMAEIEKGALKRAAVVGGVDAISGLIGAKNLTAGMSSKFISEVTNAALQMPIQAGLGAAGEAGGELARGRTPNIREVAAEAAGEFVTAPVEIAGAAISGARAQVEDKTGGPLEDLTADELRKKVDDTKAARSAQIEQAQEAARQEAAAQGLDPLEQEMAAAQAGLEYSSVYEADVTRLNRLWEQRLAADEEARYFEEQQKEDAKRAEIQAAAAKRYEEGLAQIEQEKQTEAERARDREVVKQKAAGVEAAVEAAQRQEREAAAQVAETQRRREVAENKFRKLRRMRQEKGLEPKAELPGTSPYPSKAEVEAFKGKRAPSTAMAAAFTRAAETAATSPTNALPEPTQAQIEAGNYKKGHASVQGLDVTIENPAGSTRTGVSPAGEQWSTQMKDHYGYIKGTQSAEGVTEKLDVFVGDDVQSDQVFVVDQLNQEEGGFDEHKVMIGYPNQMAAIRAYRRNFKKGWKVGPVTQMSMDEFKQWTKTGDMTRPLQKIARPSPKMPATAEQFEEVIQAKTRKEGRRPRVLFRKGEAAQQDIEEIEAAPAPTEAPESFKPVQMKVSELKDVPGDKQRKSMAEMKEFVAKVKSGEIKPNVIVQTKNGKPIRIVEGNHTLRALRLLGVENVTVRTQEVGEPTIRLRVPENPPRSTTELASALVKEKGFSADPQTGAAVTEGYAVGIGAEEKMRGYGGEAFIDGYRRRHAEELSQPDVVFGGWVYEGETYLDVSRIFPETPEGLEAATALAKKNHEIGIMQLSKAKTGDGYIAMEYTPEELAAPVEGDTLEVTHYGKVPDLNILEGKYYGTGIKGAEAQRLAGAEAADIRDRVYFYTGKHRREAGLGPHVYKWTQANVYNIEKDPMNFRDQIDPELKGMDRQNEFDRIVKNAGYSGVYSPSMNGIGYLFGDVNVEYKGRVADLGLFRKPDMKADADVKPTFQEVQALVDEIQERLPLLQTEVIQDVTDLPTEMYTELAEMNGFSAKGMYHVPSGKLYIVVENADNLADVVKTIMHEGVAHKGLRYLLGDQLPALLRDIFETANPQGLFRIARIYGYDVQDKADQPFIAEEYIAHLAEGDIDAPLLQRVIDLVRSVLRDLGMVHQWTDNDIKALLRDSRAGLRAGKPLSKIMISSELEISDTGEVVEIEQQADVAIRQMDKRINMLEKLRGCVG